jgi:hypothetical protein
LGDLVDVRIILTWISKIQGVGMLTGMNWLMIGNFFDQLSNYQFLKDSAPWI